MLQREQCAVSEAITISTELKNWSMWFITRAVCKDQVTSEACGSSGFQGIRIKDKRRRPTKTDLYSNQICSRFLKQILRD